MGFQVFSTDDIDDMGPEGVAAAIKRRIGDTPCYLSFDIDTIDPSMAPASESHRDLFLPGTLKLTPPSSFIAGTPESGGWSTREVKRIIRGLAGLNIVGADIVEVSPAYDTNAELTAMAAADLALEFLALMIAPDGPVPASKNGELNAALRAHTAAGTKGRVKLVDQTGARDEL